MMQEAIPRSSQLRPARTFHDYRSQLEIAHGQKGICLDRISELKSSCATRCEKKHIVNCAGCYSEVLDAMRQRYRESPPSCEWFHARPGFLNGLDSLFSEAMEDQARPAAIEQWISEQKNLWYRSEVTMLEPLLAIAEDVSPPSTTALADRRVVDISPVTGTGSNAGFGSDGSPTFFSRAFQGLARQSVEPVDKLVGLIWAVIGNPNMWWANPHDLPIQLGPAQQAADNSNITGYNSSGSNNDATNANKGPIGEPKQVYVDRLFCGYGETSHRVQQYVESYLNDDDAKIVEVMGRIAQAHDTWLALRTIRNKRRRRLDELRRGAAAVRQNKDMVAKGRVRPVAANTATAAARQATANADSVKAQGLATNEKYRLPACFACSGRVDAAHVISCGICQIFTELGIQGSVMTIYCSRKCFEQAHEHHVQQTHECEAGDGCVSLMGHDNGTANGETPSRVVYRGNSHGLAGPVLCARCVGDLGRRTVYCSRPCATRHIQNHRETIHIPACADQRMLMSNRPIVPHATCNDRLRHNGYTEQQQPNIASETGHVIEDAILNLDETLEKVFKWRNPGVIILGIESQ